MKQDTIKNAPGTMPKIIIRHGQPGKHDHAPQGTLCLVHGEDCENTYRQMSPEEDEPYWLEM